MTVDVEFQIVFDIRMSNKNHIIIDDLGTEDESPSLIEKHTMSITEEEKEFLKGLSRNQVRKVNRKMREVLNAYLAKN